MKSKTKKQIFSVFLLITFLASVITFAFMYNPQEETEDDVWVAKVSVVINGDLEIIPSELGIDNETRGRIYTLEADNLIYKNTDEQIMLREVFDLWGESFNSTCVMDYCNNENSSIRMYVNDVERLEYELYTIQNRDNIVIDYR